MRGETHGTNIFSLATPTRQAHLVPEGEVHVLEVPVPPLCGPVLLYGGVAVPTAHVQREEAVLGGPFMGDIEGGDGDLEGQQAGVVAGGQLLFHFRGGSEKGRHECMLYT